MTPAAAKRDAAQAGLALFYDRQWRAWGLIDPDARCESDWLSPADLRSLTQAQFAAHIETVCERRNAALEGA